MFRIRLTALPILATLGAAVMLGCGTTEAAGPLGATFGSGPLSVRVDRIATEVPAGRFSVPPQGSRLVAVHVRVCSEGLGAVVGADFGLDVTGGGGAVQRPATFRYRDDFSGVRSGCGAGWLVWTIDDASRVERATFDFSNNGVSTRQGGPQDSVDAAFAWVT